METIGAFQIRKPLGRGVTGVVYEAYNPIRGVVAAVKVFTQVTNRTPALKTRLLRDAQAAAALHHPNLAGVIEVGEYQGHPYVISECVEGMDLGQVARVLVDRPLAGLGPLPDDGRIRLAHERDDDRGGPLERGEERVDGVAQHDAILN